MQTNQPSPPVPVGIPLSLLEITALLIKNYDLHEGYFDLLMEFQIGVGPVAQLPTQIPTPTAMVSISRLGLTASQIIGPNSVNAAKVNPVKPKKPIKKKDD